MEKSLLSYQSGQGCLESLKSGRRRIILKVPLLGRRGAYVDWWRETWPIRGSSWGGELPSAGERVSKKLL